jgi:glycerophosphoryl diester phosphodiesterase
MLLQPSPQERLPHFAANRPANIAHAGAQGHAPANTVEAFELALDLGADTLELDAQLTADGQVVVHHDGTVDRQTDGRGAIAAMTLAQIRGLDAGYAFEESGAFPYRGEGIRIPTLDQVFKAFPDVFLIIELKTDGGPGIVDAVADRVAEHGRADNVLVASLDVDYLRAFRERMPEVATSMAEDEVRAFHSRHRIGLHRWWQRPGAFFQVPEFHDGLQVVTPRFVRAAGRVGVDVHVWTVNDPDDMVRLLDAGVHGILTDYPDRLAEVIAEHPGVRAAEADPARFAYRLRMLRAVQDQLSALEPLVQLSAPFGEIDFYVLLFAALYWSVSRTAGLGLGAVLLLSVGLNAVLKLGGFHGPRPLFVAPQLARFGEMSVGLPSAQAQHSIAVWGLLAAESRRTLGWIGAGALIVLIGLAQVQLGVDFPAHVFLGWMAGAALLGLFWHWRPRATAWLAEHDAISHLLVAFSASAGLILVGTVVRAELTGWAFPASWIGATGLDDGALGVAAVVSAAGGLFGLAAGAVALRLASGFSTAGPVGQRLLRFPIGLAGLAVFWLLLGAAVPSGEATGALVAQYLHYALVGAWIAGGAPLLFVRLRLAPTGEPQPLPAEPAARGT